MEWSGMQQGLLGRAREVIKHRFGNPVIYPQHESQHFNLQFVMQEITDAICRKHPSFCMETVPVGPPSATAPQPIQQPVSIPACSACGATDWQPTYCATCGGQKIDGYKCKKCGNKRGR